MAGGLELRQRRSDSSDMNSDGNVLCATKLCLAPIISFFLTQLTESKATWLVGEEGERRWDVVFGV
jgi:hypothetical protein